MSRSDSRKSVNGLLKEAKEKDKCKDKAVLTCTLVCSPTNCDSLRKSVELEIKVRYIIFIWELTNLSYFRLTILRLLLQIITRF